MVDIVSAQVRIAIGGLDLNHPFANFENRNIEGATAKIVDGNRFVFLLVESVGKRRCRGLVDNPLHIESGNLASIFGCLALRVVEICRHGYDGIRDLLAKVVFCRSLQLLQNHGGNLLRGVALSLRNDYNVVSLGLHFERDHLQFVSYFIVATAHKPLYGVNGVFRVGDGLALCDLSDQYFSSFGESNDGRSSPATFFVGDDLRLASFHDRYDGISSAEINTDNFCHMRPPETQLTPSCCFREKQGRLQRSNGAHSDVSERVWPEQLPVRVNQP